MEETRQLTSLQGWLLRDPALSALTLKHSFSFFLPYLPHSTTFFWRDASEGPAASGAGPFLAFGLVLFSLFGGRTLYDLALGMKRCRAKNV